MRQRTTRGTKEQWKSKNDNVDLIKGDGEAFKSNEKTLRERR